MLSGLVEAHLVHALAPPVHKKHMVDFFRAMKEVDLGQINSF